MLLEIGLFKKKKKRKKEKRKEKNSKLQYPNSYFYNKRCNTLLSV